MASPADVDRGGDLGDVSPEPAPAGGPWMRGFHGAIVHVDDASQLSVRSIALGRRHSGLGHFDALVTLPGAPAARLEPRSTTGHLPVAGSPAAAAPVAVPPVAVQPVAVPPVAVAPVAVQPPELAATPAADPAPDPDEPLDAFIDRRLAAARYLLLPNRGRAYAVSKRVVDVLVSAALLAAFSPVLLVLAAAIRLDSPGPAIFRQTRVTRGGRTFRFYKFRTMYVDARERFPELYEYGNGELDAQFYKLADDPRNTRVGRWLRRTTLDELPNLVNVLVGDLSMVGPRPDLPELVRRYRPEEFACLFTKAGLTGFAQISGRSLLTVRERLTLDLRYVSQQTLVLDLRIMWRTVVVVLSGRGAF